MVANEGTGRGPSDGEGDLPEELRNLSPEELEEVAEAMAEKLSEEDTEVLDSVMWTLCQVEAAGSLDEAQRLGALEGAPEEIGAMIRSMVPASRGGEDSGPQAEEEWQRFVDDMIEANGQDFFDEVRRELKEGGKEE